MPASAAREDQQRARIFSALFWVGVALAPLAALVLLIGSSTGSLRTAVGILVLSVIMIAVSIMLRREGETMKTELEDTLFDEVDATRADIRDDIAHAVHATHRAFGEKFQYLLDQVEATRAELEATRGQLEVLRHQLPAGPNGRVGPPAPGNPAHGRGQGMPSGIVRHTETVQVTTRHTVMDPNEEQRAGTTYGRPQTAAPRGRDDSWTEQRLREQLDRRRDAGEPGAAAERWQQREPYEERWSAPIEDDDRRPGVRAGDRWASIRDDDHGRELRMGERRAALHTDGAGGTELRIEDRWAAVRREAGLDREDRDRDDRVGRGRGGWSDEDRLDIPRGDFPYRDREREDRSRRAITSSDREDRWSTYNDDRDRDRDRDRDYDRRYRD
ncbi:hypothetical protein [Catelliglobosispora koreensis]|uniref:hypothetical protein n=1 Tax=Catelliglobosispora koreensis TaxID=129052 RepID=UPI000378772E|nr:hypothetical protein [Catelliglobosispora koreensis]